MNPLDKLKAQNKGDSDLFSWIDVFMHEYGMSFEDFKKMNIQAFFLLRERISNRYKKEAEAYKTKGKR